ncbi:MAG: hypothetical protein RJA36_2764 [Pseudomonadota bacterium]|jgi:DNA-binding MarR family transcriptional regulator
MSPNRLSQLETVNDLLLYRLGQVGSPVSSLVVRLCEGRHGITRREWRLIGQLVLHPSLSPTELARLSQLDKARTSRAIGSLVEKGLAQRSTLSGDRRKAELELTDVGRALYEQLMPEVRALNRELLQALDAEEIAQLDRLLTRLQQRAEDMVARHGASLPKTQRHLGGRYRAASGL